MRKKFRYLGRPNSFGAETTFVHPSSGKVVRQGEIVLLSEVDLAKLDSTVSLKPVKENPEE